MPIVPVNYLAVLASAVLMMVLGALWYGPLFGKQWASLMDFTDEKMKEMQAKGMAKSYILMALGALVMSYVLQHALVFGSAYLGVSGVTAGLEVGFWNWLGFVAPATVGMVLWEGKPWRVWFIVAGYYLVALLLSGMLLAVWT